MATRLTNARLFDGDEVVEPIDLLLADGAVSDWIDTGKSVGGIECEIDMHGDLLIPGFIDLQVNGGGGVLFNDAPSVETLATMAAAHARYGTTRFLPTVISDDLDVMRRAAAAVRDAVANGMPGVLGIHFEGPYLNRLKRGIHSEKKIRAVERDGIELAKSMDGICVMMTLAPEIAGAAVIRDLTDANVIVAAGHTNAAFEQIDEALAAGLAGFTHLFNAMRGLDSREPGVVGAALYDETSWFGLIADGHHVHPASVAVAVRAKARGKALLVTDAMAGVGSSLSEFALNGETITVADGVCRNADGVLAGSNLDMLSAVNNVAEFAGIDWFEAVRMATQYPARALGIGERFGTLRPGAAADLVRLNDDRQIVDVFIAGRRQTREP